MPSLGNNRHNPPLDDPDHKALGDMRHARRVTWRQFYNWAVPILREAHEREATCAPSSFNRQ